jgi:tetratricopeptide (TPR) repeat protein
VRAEELRHKADLDSLKAAIGQYDCAVTDFKNNRLWQAAAQAGWGATHYRLSQLEADQRLPHLKAAYDHYEKVSLWPPQHDRRRRNLMLNSFGVVGLEWAQATGQKQYYDTARAVFEEALRYWQRQPPQDRSLERPHEAAALTGLAQAQHALGERLTAIVNYGVARDLWRELGNWPREVGVRLGMGAACAQEGDHQAAVAAFRPAVEKWPAGRDQFELAAALNQYGASLYELAQQGAPEAARFLEVAGVYERALAIWDVARHRREKLAAWQGCAEAYYAAGQYHAALRNYQAALKLSAEDGARAYALVLRGIGLSHYALGEYEQAVKALNEGRRLWPEMADDPALLNALGMSQQQLGRLDEAEKNHQQALDKLLAQPAAPQGKPQRKPADLQPLHQSPAGPPVNEDYGTTLSKLGAARWSLAQRLHSAGQEAAAEQEYETARDWHELALPIWEKLQESNDTPRARRRLSEALNSSGALAHSRGDDKVAQDYFERARVLLAEAATSEMATTWSGLGLITKQRQEAISHFKKARNIWEQLNNERGVAVAELSLGGVYYAESLAATAPEAAQSLRAQALEQYQKALAHWQEINCLTPNAARAEEATTLVGLGTVHFAGGQYEQAIDYYRKAVGRWDEKANRREKAITLNGVARAHFALRSMSEAKHYFTEADKLWAKGEYPRVRLFTFVGQASILNLDDQIVPARQRLETVLRHQDGARRPLPELRAAALGGLGFGFWQVS